MAAHDHDELIEGPELDAPKRKWGPIKIALVSMSGLLAIVLVVMAAYAGTVVHTVATEMKHEDLLPAGPAPTGLAHNDQGTNGDGQKKNGQLPNESGPDQGTNSQSPTSTDPADQEYSGQGPIPTGEPGNQPDMTVSPSDGKAQNILLIGADAATGGVSRSDVIILAHISADQKRVDLIHFPRDYYVKVPGHGYTKINHSYAYGGSPLLVHTIQGATGVKIDHVAKTDFEGYSRTIDTIGGIDVTINESSPAKNGYPAYTKGQVVHMSGQEALFYVRERKALNQGDIGRGQRQMDVLVAIAAKVASPEKITNPVEMNRSLGAVASNLTTDRSFGVEQIASLAYSLRNVRSTGGVHSWTAPWSGASMKSGMSVVDPSWPQVEILSKALKQDTMSGYSDPVSPKRGY
ncbi:MAG: LCP family protein [Dermatophilaceae bacterium]